MSIDIRLIRIRRLLFAFLVAMGGMSAADTDWPTYLGNKERSLYSPLRRINRENVRQLQVAWTYDPKFRS